MRDDTLREQALAVADLMPRLMRRLFTLDGDDPAMDLPVAQLRVCGILRDGPQSMSSLSRELGVSLPAATQLADRLERAGLVERMPEQDDRRVRCLQLTPRGRETMMARREKRVARVTDALARLAPDSRRSVISALRALFEASATGELDSAPGEASMDQPL